MLSAKALLQSPCADRLEAVASWDQRSSSSSPSPCWPKPKQPNHGDPGRADIAARATRSFLRDHIGGWIDAWAARVEAIDELGPWFPYAATAADLVRSEAANRNAIPLREPAALPADAGVADDEEATITCDQDDSYEHSAM